MPCQFIASCFYLENPWGKSDSYSAKSAAVAAAAVEAQPVINQEPQQPQPAAPAAAAAAAAAEIAANIGPDIADIAANVEQQPAPKGAGGDGVNAASPNGTPDKASNKARTAKTFRAYLPSQCHRTYSCVHCRYYIYFALNSRNLFYWMLSRNLCYNKNQPNLTTS